MQRRGCIKPVSTRGGHWASLNTGRGYSGEYIGPFLTQLGEVLGIQQRGETSGQSQHTRTEWPQLFGVTESFA